MSAILMNSQNSKISDLHIRQVLISQIKWIYEEVMKVLNCQTLVSTTHGRI